MTRHYFHIRTGDRVELDPEGVDCADLAGAKRHAVALAAARGVPGGAWRIEIADPAGQYLASVDSDGAVAD